MARKRVAVLMSGRGSNMAALIEAAKDPSYPAEIALVLSNRPEAAGLAHAKAQGVTTAVVDHRPHGKDRSAFERALQGVLDEHRVQLVCLGGFMRLFTAPFALRWEGRMLNIHPSLLPRYRGLHTHARVLAAGDTEHGASVHFVTPELDAGPVILQSKIAVLPGESEAALAGRVLATEHIIYPRVIGWLGSGRLAWRAGAPWLDGQKLEVPIVEDFRASVV